MAFHVEISSGLRHRARAFNLDEAKLRNSVLDAWIGGRRISLGDKDWEPRDCTLIILEGPELQETDLAMGRGWSNAEKTAENVTRRLIEAASAPSAPIVAIMAEGETASGRIAGMLRQLELETISWPELRARILGPPAQSSGPGYAAVLAVETESVAASWLFDAGLARGALGRRAVVVQLGSVAIPEGLAGVEVIRIDPDDEGSVRALGERLTG